MEEELNKLTVVKLKERLRRSRLPTTGKKAELVSRLTMALNVDPIQQEAEEEDPIEQDAEEEEDQEEVLNSSSHTNSIDNEQPSSPSTPPVVPQKAIEYRRSIGVPDESMMFSSTQQTLSGQDSVNDTSAEDASEEEDMDEIGVVSDDEEMKDEEEEGVGDEEMDEQETGNDHPSDSSIMSDGAESTTMSEESAISIRGRRSSIVVPIVSKRPSAAPKKSTVSVPATVTKERLATPKLVKRRVGLRSPVTTKDKTKKGFKFGSTTVPKSFVFGSTAVEDIRSVQKASNVSTNTPSISRRVLTAKQPTTDKLDVKQRSRIIKPSSVASSSSRRLSIPVDLSLVDGMATPNMRDGRANASRARASIGYTPYKGKFQFLDTTKLTDREFEIAVEAGLINRRRSTPHNSSNAQLEASRTMSRNAYLHVQRKLALAAPPTFSSTPISTQLQ